MRPIRNRSGAGRWLDKWEGKGERRQGEGKGGDNRQRFDLRVSISPRLVAPCPLCLLRVSHLPPVSPIARRFIDCAGLGQRVDTSSRSSTTTQCSTDAWPQCGCRRSVERDQAAVEHLRQLVGGQRPLRGVDRRMVYGRGVALDKHGQRIEIAALPDLALLAGPGIELGRVRQREAIQKWADDTGAPRRRADRAAARRSPEGSALARATCRFRQSVIQPDRVMAVTSDPAAAAHAGSVSAAPSGCGARSPQCSLGPEQKAELLARDRMRAWQRSVDSARAWRRAIAND